MYGELEIEYVERSRKKKRIFDALLESIMIYGVEIWSWRGWEEVEKIQDTYMKWVMKLDRRTPRHMLHEETDALQDID